MGGLIAYAFSSVGWLTMRFGKPLYGGHSVPTRKLTSRQHMIRQYRARNRETDKVVCEQLSAWARSAHRTKNPLRRLPFLRRRCGGRGRFQVVAQPAVGGAAAVAF